MGNAMNKVFGYGFLQIYNRIEEGQEYSNQRMSVVWAILMNLSIALVIYLFFLL